MKNVLVGVTRQRASDRLISYGRELVEGTGGNLFVVHVMGYPLTELSQRSAEVLEYLQEKATECDVNLTMVRSNNTVATLVSMVNRLEIGAVVIGETRQDKPFERTIHGLLDILQEECQVIIVPRKEDEDEE